MWRGATLALLVAMPLSGCQFHFPSFPSAAPKDTSDIVIGASLELSGAYAAIGTTYQQALQLRVDEVNSEGGVDGRQLRLEVVNNKSDPTDSAASVVDLLSRPGIAAMVLGYNTDTAKNSAKTVADKQVTTIALAPGDAAADPVNQRAYTFKIGPNATDTGTVLADYLTNTLKKNTVALLGTNDAAGKDQTAVLDTTLGNRVVAHSTFSPSENENGLSTRVANVLVAAPDALIVSTLPDQAWAVARQARRHGFTGPIMFNATAAGDLFNAATLVSSTSGPPSTQIYLVATQTLVSDDVVSVTPADAARRQWFSDYLAKFGGYSGYSSYAADAIDMIVAAVRTAGGTDHVRLRSAVENAQFDGVTGLIRMTPAGHSGLSPSSLTVLQAGTDRWQLPS
ncbi:MAG: ABC transporter substrate-binding protein [Micromonosporaceae bacterium]|nr:ABC transporter substrate-binding protein [Micromonosporaceae bacterium]